MKTRILIAAAALVCLASCVTNLTTGTTQLSRELVDKNLIKGKTTKEQVRALLGEPQSTTSNDTVAALPGMPAETWAYSKKFYRDSMEKGAAYSFAHVALTNSIYDRVEVSILVVMFDAHGRVCGHTFSTSSAGAGR